MSEKKAGYATGTAQLRDFQGLPCTLRFADEGYQAPTPAQVDALIQAMGWSQNDVAKLVGVVFDPAKGSLTVRRWRTDATNEYSRAIPYAAWRLMLLAAGVVDRP